MRRILASAGLLAILSHAAPAAAQGPPVTAPEPFDDVVTVKDPDPVPEATPKKKPRPSMAVSMLGGGVVGLMTEADVGVAPVLTVAVSGKVAANDHAPKLEVSGEFGSLPGEAITCCGNLENFRSLEFRTQIVQPLFEDVWIDPYAELGFATRLNNDAEPRDRTARFWSVGVKFGRVSRGWLKLGIGSDQRLDGDWRNVVVMMGSVKLRQPRDGGILAKATIVLGVEAILGLSDYSPGFVPAGQSTARDSVRVKLSAGI